MASTIAGAAASAGGDTSNHVYVRHPDLAWVPARVVSHHANDNGESNVATTATVSVRSTFGDDTLDGSSGRSGGGGATEEMVVDLSDYDASALPLQNVDENGRLKEVDDMVDLPFLHEAAILYNLKARHLRGVPYTRTGDIVIAVNPYHWIDGLYSVETRDLFSNRLVWDDGGGRGGGAGRDERSEVEPHVYEASALAYRGLAHEGLNQSILVSGESGAGKTETVKILMQHLASIQATGGGDGDDDDDGPGILHDYDRRATHKPLDRRMTTFRTTTSIVERVLDANPLLEAFGNAKTVRNDNSSRFGKFLQLQFDAEDPTHAAYRGQAVGGCVLAGSKCDVYLLEKSRIVDHEDNERTYHVFYQLLSAPDDVKEAFWDGLSETDADSFAYVGYSDTTVIEGKTDAQRWDNTVEALAIVGVTDDKLKMLVRALCIVLQLGNLVFEPSPDNEENSVITTRDELEMLADLMGVSMDTVERTLTERTVVARNETFRVPLTDVKAGDARDAFAKEIYASTFHWLVRTINDATCAENNYDQDTGGTYGTIGLLDIFGFESFEVNRFEQLCINYANEKLQQKFTLDIFRSVQMEYEEEGIEIGEVEFADNAEVLNLVEGHMGLIAVLNEECVRPKGNDCAFVSKVNAMNKDSDCLIQDNFFREYEFGVRHYAGPVVYDATHFVTKNMDALPADLTECAKQCTNDLVSKELGMGGADTAGSGSSKAAKRKAPRGAAARGGNSGGAKRKGSSIASQTVWTQFRTQLASLMANIGETRSRYIRCIKPNTEKKPRVMQHLSTVEQLRCAGVVAAVTISRSTFPNRLQHEVTWDRFLCLKAKGFVPYERDDEEDFEEGLRSDIDQLLTTSLKGLEVKKGGAVVKAFVCGKTRTYFRAGSLEYLEGERLKALGVHAVTIQRMVRGRSAHSAYVAVKKAVLKIQSTTRKTIARRLFSRIVWASISIQCWARGLQAVQHVEQLRRDFRATMIQTHWRMAVATSTLKKCRGAAVKIQKIARGANQRPKYRKALVEAKEEAKLENQLKSLQRKLEEAEAKRLAAEKRAKEKEAKTKVVYKELPITEERQDEGTETSPEVSAKASPPPAPVVTPAAAHASVTSPTPGWISTATGQTGQLSVHQQTLMDESGRMLEYLRKEVFKLRNQNSQLRADFDLLKENNQRLMDANASAGASFAALNQHAKQLNKTNAKLVGDITKYKQKVHDLNVLQLEMKDELIMKQESYVAEVQTRLQYERTMGQIVDMIQDRCRDSRLVEDVLVLADECESDLMGGSVGDASPVSPVRSVGSRQVETPQRSSRKPTLTSETSLSARFKSFFGGGGPTIEDDDSY